MTYKIHLYIVHDLFIMQVRVTTNNNDHNILSLRSTNNTLQFIYIVIIIKSKLFQLSTEVLLTLNMKLNT